MAKQKDENIMLVRPAIRSLGLDYLHVSLIALVFILIALAYSLSTFKGIALQNCPYGISSNGICNTPQHTSAQALSAGEQIIASYSPTNSSLSLLPYYSIPNQAQVSYLSNTSEWLVVVPYTIPTQPGQRFYFSMLLYDSNLTLAKPFLQVPASPYTTQNKAIAFGVVSIFGKSACALTSNSQIPIYSFIDPYAPGALNGMQSGVNATSTYGNKINVSYKFIFTGYALSLYNKYGLNRTQQNGEFLWCASLQQRFPAFLKNYSILFSGAPLDNATLEQVANGSGLNMSAFNTCLLTAGQKLNYQAVFASFYSVNTTPTYVVDCQYETIPQTLNAAIGYAINQTK